VKNPNAVRKFYVLPCCLLLLNLCVELVSYKAKMIDDVLLRTGAIMGMVLVGGSIVGLVMAPAIGALIGWLHATTRTRWGELGEIFFLLALGIVVFWLYYRVYIIGPESVLPAEWRNPRHFR
jgi:MFS family permease